MRFWLLALLLTAAFAPASVLAQDLQLNDRGYFHRQGLDVTVFADIYPDGHQTGVTVIQHGVRVAANGDLRLEISPGQWSPVPAGGERVVDTDGQRITQRLSYPDPSKNRTGFNPIDYPDLDLSYSVSVTPVGGNAVRVTVDLDRPLPAEWVGKVGFNLELFPGDLFGRSYLMDGQTGVFPRQANGPVAGAGGETTTAPLAEGRRLTVAPEADLQRLTIESRSGELTLVDGRGNHNNGWFIVRGLVPAGADRNALEWIITPNVVEDWRYQPVIQLSQVGYRPAQPKRAIFEQDPADPEIGEAVLYRLTDQGREVARRGPAVRWDGDFLRYAYLTWDFSEVSEPGAYVLSYRGRESDVFRIGDEVLDRHVWQPTLEYFLPVQMCHMLVRENYRTWHGLDHMDDARMAPTDLNHFDGYVQGASTLTRFQPGERIPGMDAGGWHDAGDYDMRIESQMGTVWLLAKMVTEFGLDYDATAIDQAARRVELLQADGRNDAQQQIEHGLLSVLGGYRAMGRLYRGVIEPTLDQYVLLGDVTTQTDNLAFDASLGAGERTGSTSSAADDRWIFTEDNPNRELGAAAGLAAASVALRGYDDALAAESLAAARDVIGKAIDRTDALGPRVRAASEMLLATGEAEWSDRLIALKPAILAKVEDAWPLAQVIDRIPDAAFRTEVSAAVAAYQARLRQEATLTPYGVPYEPNIWGAGWQIQEFGVRQWFFRQGWPEHTSDDFYVNALNFVLGAHPGENTSSFASGVGARSPTTAYGTNRADWSYIPGGVISGTALIRPDLPELKVWPYFWQQTEYVMGGGETNYMFLVLAVDALYDRSGTPAAR